MTECSNNVILVKIVSLDENNVENLIVGFGLASIPVVRELEKTNHPYLIISANSNIWTQMNRNHKLNFDLVSTKASSMFSWDLAQEKTRDGFLTAQQFFDYQQKYYDIYKNKIINDTVVKVRNFKNYSLVYTKKGAVYRAKNVIFGTGFKRSISRDIINFNSNIKNKTIVFDAIGDTTNMFISDLVANNNKLYIVSNGFMPVNKIHQAKGGLRVTLDQFEYPNVAFYSKKTHEDTLGMSLGTVFSFTGARISDLKKTETYARIFKNKNTTILNKVNSITDAFSNAALRCLSKVFCGNAFHVKHERLIRVSKVERSTEMPAYNGVIVKYWPIESYFKSFSETLGQSIDSGRKLNDLPFFIEEGLVFPLMKEEVSIDKTKKEMSVDGRIIKYDHLIKGELERPQLNDIEIINEESQERYEFIHRDNYLGVIPPDLNGIYIAGLTRPNSGGFTNISEIQSILVHKMISNEKFKQSILCKLSSKVDKYNKKYQTMDSPTPADHIVFYGFYIEEVAREIGINPRLKDCRTRREFLDFFFVPNNTSKYRITGEYRVKGLRFFYQKFKKQYNFIKLYYIVSTYLTYRIIFYSITALAILNEDINLFAGILLLAIQTCCSRFFMIFIENQPELKWFTSRLWLCFIPFMPLTWNLFIILGELCLIPVLRKFGWKNIFNDMSSKGKYRNFFYKEYLPALKRSLDKSS